MRRVAQVVIIALAAVAALAAYASFPGELGERYLTATVERGNIERTIAATGTVRPLVTVQVGSQLSGQIAELYADFNDTVKKGDPLARLDPQTFEAQVNQARAALAIAQAELLARQAAVERARAGLANARAKREVLKAQVTSARATQRAAARELERKQSLSARGAVSASELDEATARNDAMIADVKGAEATAAAHETAISISEAELHIAEAQLGDARGRITQAEAVLQQAEVELARSVIRAPIDGVIIRRDVDRGQTVAASLEAPTLFTIAQDLRRMEVHAKIHEADIGRIALGQRALFTVDSYPGRSFEGEVVQIRKGPEVVQNIVTYAVLISAGNADLALLPGMTATVQIVVETFADVLKVPNGALRFRPPGTGTPDAQSGGSVPADDGPGAPAAVWVVDPQGQASPVTVRIAARDATTTGLVSDKLRQGQSVILGLQPVDQGRTVLGLRLGW